MLGSSKTQPRRPTRLNGLPLVLYRLRLGFLLKRSHVRLMHRGRKTGITREVFLEVLAHRGDEIFVAALWGRESDWYRNLQLGPVVGLQLGRTVLTPSHRFVPAEEAEELLRKYSARFPRRVRIRQERIIRRPLTAESTPVVAFRVR